MYRHLLLVVDGQQDSVSIIVEAVELAWQLSASMHALVMTPDLLDSGSQIQAEALAFEYSIGKTPNAHFATNILQTVHAHGSALKVTVSGEIVNVVAAVDDILKAAEVHKSDAIVMSRSLWPRLSDLLMGTVAERLVKKASVPIMLLNPSERPQTLDHFRGDAVT